MATRRIMLVVDVEDTHDVLLDDLHAVKTEYEGAVLKTCAHEYNLEVFEFMEMNPETSPPTAPRRDPVDPDEGKGTE